MQLDDDEIALLLSRLETHNDLSVAELDGVHHALAFLLGDRMDGKRSAPQHLNDAEDVLHIANTAYPDWVINIHGRADDRDGHWRCSLRKGDTFDSDAVIGHGRSPVLAQAILAAVIRLAMTGSAATPAD